MCDPIALVGAGLSVAGGVSNAASNAATVNATNAENMRAYKLSKAARTAEIARQKGFETQADGTVNGTIGSLDKTHYDASREAAIQDFVSTLDSRPGSIDGGFTLSGQDNASPEIQQEIARRSALAAQEARTRVEALAKLSSYDGAALDRSLSMGKSADALSTINGFRRGSLGVSQSEQSIPSATVTSNPNFLADIMSGAGGALTGASWKP